MLSSISRLAIASTTCSDKASYIIGFEFRAVAALLAAPLNAHIVVANRVSRRSPRRSEATSESAMISSEGV